MNNKIFTTAIFAMLFFISACEDQGNPVTPPPIIIITPTPAITSVTPDSGAVGDTIKIIGTNFGSTQGTSSVKFGIVSAATFINWTSAEIRVKIPIGASTDSINVSVSNKPSNKIRFKVLVSSTAPNITSVSPDSGKVGDTITVNGTNFGTTQSSSTVSFGATNATAIIPWSATQVKVIVPSGLSAGSTTIAMTVGGQSGNAKAFKVLSSVVLVKFSTDITPLLSNYGCSGCHGSSGGLNVLPHSSLLAGTSNNGPVIIVGDGEGSNLVKKLRGTAGFGSRMPQGGPFMINSEIQKFVDWINQGALNN